jgi:type IV pilus assembly protein PilF
VFVVLAGALVQAGCVTNTTPGKEGEIKTYEGDNSLAHTHVQLGVEYMRKGKYNVAYAKLQKALELDPNLPSAHYANALLFEHLRQDDRAEEHYRRAIEIDPLYSKGQNGYAVFLCKKGRYDEADRHFNQALKNPLYTTPEYAYTGAGYCSLQNNKMTEAEEYLRQALRVSPRYPGALLEMSRLNYKKGKYLPARGYLQRYLEVSRHNPESLWLGIQIEEQLGDKNAVASYKLLLKSKFPDSQQTQMLEKSENPQ